jgi:Tfp pilus assembly PilM family ATPase
LQKQFGLDADEAAAALQLSTRIPDGAQSDTIQRAVDDAVDAYTDRLLKEARLAFSYVARQYGEAAIASVLLGGGGANVAPIASCITAALDAKSELMWPSQFNDHVTASPAGTSARCDVMAAVGLAMFPLQAQGGEQ